MNPLIPIAAGIGALYLLMRSSGASTGTGGGSRAPTGDGGDKPTGPRIRVLKDAGNTELPGGFANEYSGNWKRWIELPGANPGMSIQYEQFESGATTPWGLGPNPSVYSGPSGRGTTPYGLLPWANGQEVALPDDWAG